MKIKIVLMLVAAAFVFSNVALAADYVLVVNKGNAVSSIDAKDAKKIFLGKKSSWNNGERIVLYSQQNQTLTEAFSEGVVRKSAQQFMVFWKKALFTGTGKPPVEVSDDAQMKQAIAADPKGIGYISASAMDGTVKQLIIN
ncbi:MAG: phosphate ABC transporter substrate-binding protein [Desulfuromonas sp.]|jgi:ABC-type phosphate transport system substrate-binding protein|nr:MAG: phosphate ABC transporter substrate-binding protein [Desulfuromonas sp.]